VRYKESADKESDIQKALLAFGNEIKLCQTERHTALGKHLQLITKDGISKGKWSYGDKVSDQLRISYYWASFTRKNVA